jgi:hypothetical protein
MIYYQDANSLQHVLQLTTDETNQFFDPFDPNDNSLPSHLHHVGHRFIKQPVYDWLMNNVSSEEERLTDTPMSWRHIGMSTRKRVLVFENKADAMKFKLAWGGQ